MRVEPTGIVDLLITTVPGRSTGAISRATVSTNERSAEPSSPWGVGTHRNTNAAMLAAFGAPSTNRSRRDAEALGEQLGQAVLEDRDLALVEPVDAVGVDVGAHDVVARGGPGRPPWSGRRTRPR